MADIDLNISNGTCFYARHAEAADGFLPCGNAALAGYQKSCCYAGDKCVSSKACYNKQYGITYLAGCTDPEYGAPECPGKGPYGGQQLVGLARCEPESSKWAGCEDREGRTKPEERNDNCTCEGQEPLFDGGTKLADIAWLPRTSGGAMSWFPGQTPTTLPPPAVRTTTTRQASGVTSSPDSAPTSGASVDPSSSSSSAVTAPTSPPTAEALSVGAKAGIGAGTAAFCLLLGCLVFIILLLFRRRKQQHQHQHQPAAEIYDDGNTQHHYAPSPASHHHHASFPAAPSPPMLGAVPAYPGLPGYYKSELPADVPGPCHHHQHHHPGSSPDPDPELDDNFSDSNYAKNNTNNNNEIPPAARGHERYSTVSTLHGGGGGSSQGSHSPSLSVSCTSQQQHSGQENPGRAVDGAGGNPLDPISELQG